MEPSVHMGTLPSMVGYTLRRAQLAVFGDFHRTMLPLELSPAQYTVLHLLSANPPLRSGEMAAALGIKPANFVVLLEKLERSGLVERTPDPRDGRATTIHLLPDGKALLCQADRLLECHERRIVEQLGAEGAETLCRLLGQLATIG